MEFSNPAAIRQAFEHQEQRIVTLEAQLASLRAAGQRSRPSLPNPRKFTGVRYDTWLPLVRTKLDIDGEALGGSVKAHF
jgi:hypothetical protein